MILVFAEVVKNTKNVANKELKMQNENIAILDNIYKNIELSLY